MFYFEPLTAFVDSLSSHYGIPSCDLIVCKDGKEVYRHLAGFSDAEGKVPASENDLYRLYSATKIATCTCALRLMEEGRLGLEDPVSRYLPAYADLTVRQADGRITPAEDVMTVWHLMTMTGGLNYDMKRGGAPRILVEKGDQAGTWEICNAFAEAPLDFEPGAHFQYSLCHDVLGAVIEKASGMKFGEYMKQVILDPLGMKDTTFHTTAEQTARVSEMRQCDPKTWEPHPVGKGDEFRLSPNYESGGGGLTSSAHDYMLFGAALANHGTALNGYQLLKPETVDLFRTPQLSPELHMDMMRSFPYMPGYDYGLGVRTFVNNAGSTAAKGHFGWDGAGGFLLYADPDNNMSFVFAEAVLGGTPSALFVHNKLRDLIYLCLRGSIEDYNEELKAERAGK